MRIPFQVTLTANTKQLNCIISLDHIIPNIKIRWLWIRFSKTNPHIFCFLRIELHLIIRIESKTSCMLLHSPFIIHSLCVQSSAYLYVLTSSSSGTHASKSSKWILNKVGESTDPCGTPAGQPAIDHNA